MTSVLALVGALSIIAGVALIYPPAGLIVGGLLALVAAFGAERGAE